MGRGMAPLGRGGRGRGRVFAEPIPESQVVGRSIYVNNVPADIDSKDLIAHFEDCGQVESTHVFNVGLGGVLL